MQINQLIQTNADIITVLTVKRGDVYKRLEESSYGAPKLLFGIVTDTLANGEKAVITAIEVTATYNSVEVNEKVFAGEGDVQLYPATVEDFELYRASMIETADRARRSALDAYEKAEALYVKVQAVQGLSATEAETITLAERKAQERADEERLRIEAAADAAADEEDAL